MLAGAVLVAAAAPGGAAVVSNVPWLTMLWLVPLAGSVLIILLPPGLRQVAKWTGLMVSVADAGGARS